MRSKSGSQVSLISAVMEFLDILTERYYKSNPALAYQTAALNDPRRNARRNLVKNGDEASVLPQALPTFDAAQIEAKNNSQLNQGFQILPPRYQETNYNYTRLNTGYMRPRGTIVIGGVLCVTRELLESLS